MDTGDLALFRQFQRRLATATVTADDFATSSLSGMFRDSADPFVRKIAECGDPLLETGEEKLIVHVPLGDGWNVRLDFLRDDGTARLVDLDSFTIPLKRVDSLPHAGFEPLPPEDEARMREEYRITRIVNDYVRLKEILGKEKALEWFKDGAGEKTGVPAWMPYFTSRKSFVAYTAWIQSRLHGEHVSITQFTEARSQLHFRASHWLSIYTVASHLKSMLPREEYLELHETIWQDRASAFDCRAEFAYDGKDIRITFTADK
jgi:hypothetical protein